MKANILKLILASLSAGLILFFVACEGTETKSTRSLAGGKKIEQKSSSNANSASNPDDQNPSTAPVDNAPIDDANPDEDIAKDSLVLSWKANSETYLLGYEVLAQEKDSADAPVSLKEFNLDAVGFNPDLPSISIPVKDDPIMATFAGKEICFILRALISGQKSDDSALACIQL